MKALLREYLPVLVVYVAVLFGFGFTWSVSEESRDQFCTTTESQHRIDIEGLQRTYEYLGTLSPKQISDPNPLTRAILRGLKSSEARAHTDPAPPLCDGGSLFHGQLGEPEPDPVAPHRPASLEGVDGP